MTSSIVSGGAEPWNTFSSSSHRSLFHFCPYHQSVLPFVASGLLWAPLCSFLVSSFLFLDLAFSASLCFVCRPPYLRISSSSQLSRFFSLNHRQREHVDAGAALSGEQMSAVKSDVISFMRLLYRLAVHSQALASNLGIAVEFLTEVALLVLRGQN